MELIGWGRICGEWRGVVSGLEIYVDIDIYIGVSVDVDVDIDMTLTLV